MNRKSIKNPSLFAAVFAISCLACGLFLNGCRNAAAPVSVSNKPVSINNVPTRNAPDAPARSIEKLGWTKFDGARQMPADLKGKVFVLDLWATYCKPCLEEIPHLGALYEKYGAENLEIVGLHIGGEEDRPLVPAFVEKLKINYTLATPDETLTAALMRNNDSIPQTFVFDRSGVFVKAFVGYDNQIKDELEEAIVTALNK